MVSNNKFRQLALSFEGVDAAAHCKKVAFRVHQKIFATHEQDQHRMVLRLSPTDQSVFCLVDPSVIYPVSGSWGKRGWTIIKLQQVKTGILHDALTAAYCHTAPQKLSEKYRQQ